MNLLHFQLLFIIYVVVSYSRFASGWSSVGSAADPGFMISNGQHQDFVQFVINFHSPSLIANNSGNLIPLAMPLQDPFYCSISQSEAQVLQLVSKYVILRGSGCVAAWYDRAIQLQQLGAKGVIFFTDDIIGRDIEPSFDVNFSKIDIPMVHALESDLSMWMNQLQSGVNVTISMPFTGPCSLNDKLALASFASSVSHSRFLSNVISLKQFAIDYNFIDPCIKRVEGVTCFNGRIIELRYPNFGMEGNIASINNITSLEILNLRNNLFQNFPAFDHLIKLRVFEVSNNWWQPTYSFPPAIGPTFDVSFFDKKFHLEGIAFDYFWTDQQIPKLSQNINLKAIRLVWNLWSTAMPFNFSHQIFPNLTSFSLIGCFMLKELPSLANFSKLENIVLQYGGGFNPVPASEDMFDNLPSLKSLVMQSYRLITPMKMFDFKNTNNLQILTITRSSISGGVTSLDMPHLESLNLKYNELSGPFKFFCPKLKHLDLSSNIINNALLCVGFSGPYCIDYFIAETLPRDIVYINLNGNALHGSFGIIPLVLPSLSTLDVSSNKLVFFQLSKWTIPMIETIDVSSNMLNFSMDSDMIPATLQNFFLAKNPNLVNHLWMNYIWLDPSVWIQLENYACPSPSASYWGGSSLKKISADPYFFLYSSCVCDRGFFGVPPNCKEISPIITFPNNNERLTSSHLSDANVLIANERYSSGSTIIWNVKTLTSKYIIFNIIINTALFSNYSDSLEIFEGGTNLSGVKIFSTRGDQNSNTKINIVSLKGESTVVFSSKNIGVKRDNLLKTIDYSGQGYYDTDHPYFYVDSKTIVAFFETNVTFFDVCPDGTLFLEYSGKCHFFFQPSSSISTIVFVIAAVSIILTSLVSFVVIKNRNTLVMKSSSIPFCLSILFFLVLMALSSIFYAIEAKRDWVCHIRPWLTSASLVGVLSALLVKADRIRKIFNSTELVVQSISNAQLFKIMFSLLALQSGISIFFSASNLGKSFAIIGKGATNNLAVWTCGNSVSSNEIFNAWFAIQTLYLSLFLLCSIFIAWQIRKVPTAFNEAPAISSCLMSIVLLLIIIVPLNFMIDDNPNGLILIRGVGQVAVSIILLFFLFGPKIFYVLDGRANDKSLSSVGSKASSNSSTSSSSV